MYLEKIKSFFQKNFTHKVALIIFILLAIFASSQSFLLGPKKFEGVEKEYTKYNNYLINKNSHFHLIENKNLYIHYLDKQWDLYKYSPTFAMLFGVLAYFPDLVGVYLWNLLNAIILFIGVWKLPIEKNIKLSILFFVPIEMMTSIQNEQSNALLAGLIILSLALMENKNVWLATFCIVFSVYIKLFGIVAFCILLFYPNKLKTILVSFFWVVVFLLLPLIAIDIVSLKNQYLNWFKLLKMDHGASYSYSFMYWLESWFGLVLDKFIVVTFGILTFLIPYIKVLFFHNNLRNRLMILASVLIWIVIFNHKAESPTFVIAFSGIAIWYFIQEPTNLNKAIVIFAFVFTGLSATDFFPPIIRNELFKPYVIKVFPCIIVWFKIFFDLILDKTITNLKFKIH